MPPAALRLDLHLHTTHSDGSLPVREVLTRAQQAGVVGLAITDHDTVAGIPEALALGHELGMDVLPGIEISSRHGDAEVHILGYCFDWTQPELLSRLASLRASRHERNPQIVEKLRSLGMDISYEEVRELAGTESVGRPHIARVLMQKRYVASAKEAFDRYLANGKTAYVPRSLPDPVTAVGWILSAGGVPVLAHPTWVRESRQGLVDLCRTLKEQGLKGVEVHYSTHRPSDTAEYLQLARSLDLLVTGGSDFHGETKPDIDVGIGRGNLTVPATLLEPIRKAARASDS
jgi:hypothetical protein